jgi:hypothetical protein
MKNNLNQLNCVSVKAGAGQMRNPGPKERELN